MDNLLVFSVDAKKAYLVDLSKDLVKILGLIEDEVKSGDHDKAGSAGAYIYGTAIEVNTANTTMFDQALVKVVIKLEYVSRYLDLPFSTVRKQLLESKSIVDKLYKKFSTIEK